MLRCAAPTLNVIPLHVGLQVRKVEYKDDAEEEWKKFEKELKPLVEASATPGGFLNTAPKTPVRVQWPLLTQHRRCLRVPGGPIFARDSRCRSPTILSRTTLPK